MYHIIMLPVTAGGVRLPRQVVEVILGIGIVSTTPALVPIHSMSLHTSRAVIRKHAALCWRIISSAAEVKERLLNQQFNTELQAINVSLGCDAATLDKFLYKVTLNLHMILI